MSADRALSPIGRVGDLIAISRAPAVISLTAVEAWRDRLCAGEAERAELAPLLAEYHLGDQETRAAFETMLRSLGRTEPRGDAFTVAGVYGSGKSHLLAALALLAGHPREAWPCFLETHAEFGPAAQGFAKPKLVAAIALDEYPTQSHPLEHVVFSRLERELARRHGVRVALTEDSHLLQLVREYVLPQCGATLEAAAREATGLDWGALCDQDSEVAVRVALDFLARTDFPLDWRRSRAEAWGALRVALGKHGIDGPVILLDELGLFLAGKDRKGLNADASFLQYLAQLTGNERSWLICVTQRGLEEVGDIDRRTLRQMRDRFRTTLALDLAELGWVVEHKLVRKLDPASFPREMARLHAGYQEGGDIGFSPEELARAYPLNPVCLQAVQRAAETCLSRTRSVTRLLQEAMFGRGWTEFPASRLITLEAAFDLLTPELPHSPEGRRALSAVEAILANAGRIAPQREIQLAAVVKALGLLALGELRWPVAQLRAGLVGGEDPSLWQRAETLRELLAALYRRGAQVERARREGEDADEYYLDLSSTANERIRQRLRELLAELTPADSRVPRSALEACTEAAFPLAGLLDARALPVEWRNARRHVSVACRDLTGLSQEELCNLAGTLASPQTREEGALFLALPRGVEDQERAWADATRGLDARFGPALLAWLPRPLTAGEQDHLIEHAALARMVADPTLVKRHDAEVRGRLRARWTDSAAEVRSTLQRAYYEGKVAGANREVAVETERLWALFGGWEATLTAAFAGGFARLYPRFAAIAPERRLAGRTHTNQIIDQFLRPGEVHLPPASALETHLLAYAKPLGLLEGQDRDFRLALSRGDLVAAVLAATPARGEGEQLEPAEVIPFGELAGKLAKSEWGLTREQTELLVAALLRTGHLVALDAFLQPLRFEVVAAPLSDFLPYVTRARPLRGAAEESARSLWAAATGAAAAAWDLPAQERVWRDLLAWSGRLLSFVEQKRAALAHAAEALGHEPDAWASRGTALSRAAAVAHGVDGALASREGLLKLVQAADRLPGHVPGSAEALRQWRECEAFLDRDFGELAALYRLLTDARVTCPEGSLLARARQEAVRAFASPEHLIREPAAVRSLAAGWLETYRRHYLAWHERVHAAARFQALAGLRPSATLEAMRRMARVGLLADEATRLDAELSLALSRRCLAGDPLPSGQVVCPRCGLRLGEEMALPEVEEVSRRAEAVLARQIQELQGQREMLMRRLAGCGEERVRELVGALLCAPTEAGAEGWAQHAVPLLTEDVIAWIRGQLDQPRAARKSLGDLTGALLGKELPKREVRRAVEEWLGGDPSAPLGAGEEMVEVVP